MRKEPDSPMNERYGDHHALRLREADGQSAVLPAPAGYRVAAGESGAFHDVT